ncbi:PREDICTED: uncharacterized protein LOC108524846 isoform X2 [Rhinopithecus bieti]|uniref:uncharacterized protein LOC108524846 isoform X2 n=1 Tax=Rhinopithecus bieti TaxID=61621 RepID=UPI00083C17F4|nr:PREDICTED: uncharacterized protein LOC108524846 isoform X2 [Rhinopithecus bieti]
MPSSFDLTAARTCLLCPVFTVLPTEVQEAGGVKPRPPLPKILPLVALTSLLFHSPRLGLFWPHPRIGTPPPLLTSCPRALLERGCPALGRYSTLRPAQSIPAYKLAGPVGMNHADDLPGARNLWSNAGVATWFCFNSSPRGCGWSSASGHSWSRPGNHRCLEL